jgi:hypothetical protein
MDGRKRSLQRTFSAASCRTRRGFRGPQAVRALVIASDRLTVGTCCKTRMQLNRPGPGDIAQLGLLWARCASVHTQGSCVFATCVCAARQQAEAMHEPTCSARWGRRPCKDPLHTCACKRGANGWNARRCCRHRNPATREVVARVQQHDDSPDSASNNMVTRDMHAPTSVGSLNDCDSAKIQMRSNRSRSLACAVAFDS